MPARPSWNYGDILERLEAGFPADAPALIHGDRTIRWGELGRRSNNLARTLAEEGGMPSILWAGPRRKGAVRMKVGVAFDDWEFDIACGLPRPTDAAFVLEAAGIGDAHRAAAHAATELLTCSDGGLAGGGSEEIFPHMRHRRYSPPTEANEAITDQTSASCVSSTRGCPQGLDRMR